MSKRKHIKQQPQKSLPAPKVSYNAGALTVVIPVYGRFDMLEKCLASIPEAVGDIPYNVVIYDNNSPDADIFYTNHKNEKILVLLGKENLGFPRACNIAARKKPGEFLFFLNSDVVLYPNAIKYALENFEDVDVGVVGMKLLFPKGSPSGPAGKVQHVGLQTNIRGEIEHAFIGWSPDNPKVMAMLDVIGVTGAALFIRRSMWNVVGGFDEVYGMGTYEDVDLCFKVISMGKKVMVEQRSVGEHWTGATAREYKIGYPINRNKMIFEDRWGGSFPWTQLLHA